MSTLVSRVDKRLPVTVMALIGHLDAETSAEAEPVVWGCLADLPTAVVIDAADLTYDVDGWQWLAGLCRRAAEWPGAQLSLAGGPGALNGHMSIPLFASVDSAVASYGPTESGDLRRVTLPPDPSSCSDARDLVVQACADWGLRRPRRLAELLISELVANGVMHARTDLVVTVRRHDESLELSVRDHSSEALPVPQADPRGFGLQLVAQLSDSWGWAPAGSGKVVWSRFRA